MAGVLTGLAVGFGCEARQAAPPVGADAVLPATVSIAAAAPTPQPALTPPTPTPQPALKYLFLFIGDGMGAAQARCVNEALVARGEPPLCFLSFPAVGEIATDNAGGKTTDSAAAATAIATGYKTNNGVLGQDADGNRRVSIAETLHASGMRVGILTTVSLDNATPAGFYAHTDARKNYREIGADLFISGFEYFAGGGFHGGADIVALAEEFGYTLASGDAAADAVPVESKLVLSAESLTGDRGMPLALDADDVRAGQLARNLSRGIERLLGGERGFYIMTEGGRIDLACHYHDAGALCAELRDFDLAVRRAVAFYEEHPEETLIVVTADHETGGLTLFDGDRVALLRQTVSCDRFDEAVVARLRADKTPFGDALPEICAAFGLSDLSAEETDYLKTAYRHTLRDDLSGAQREERYGVYSPVASAAANLVAERAGLAFSTYGHSGVHVPVYALGRGAEAFSGTQENTAVAEKLMELLAQFGA